MFKQHPKHILTIHRLALESLNGWSSIVHLIILLFIIDGHQYTSDIACTWK
jgi:hypothetical protein